MAHPEEADCGFYILTNNGVSAQARMENGDKVLVDLSNLCLRVQTRHGRR